MKCWKASVFHGVERARGHEMSPLLAALVLDGYADLSGAGAASGDAGAVATAFTSNRAALAERRTPESDEHPNAWACQFRGFIMIRHLPLPTKERFGPIRNR